MCFFSQLQSTVTGAGGPAGELVIKHVVSVHILGKGSVTTHPLRMEGQIALEKRLNMDDAN